MNFKLSTAIAKYVIALCEPCGASRKVLIFAFKLAITFNCFWYLLWQTNAGDLFHEAANLDCRWFVPAMIIHHGSDLL
jgi:hypothetical protein